MTLLALAELFFNQAPGQAGPAHQGSQFHCHAQQQVARMNIPSRLSRRLAPVLALCLAGISATFAWADTVYVKSGGAGAGLPTKNVVINKIAKDTDGIDSLFYTTDNGDLRHKPLDSIFKIESDAEPVFTQAEAEFAKGDLRAAADDYRKAMAASGKDWVKHRADVRLLGISGQIGDFAGAVSGFVTLAGKDPSSALAHKPNIAGAKPDQLDAAIATVNKGLFSAKADAQQVLLPFLVDLYTAKGDNAKAAATLKTLTAMQARAAKAPGADSPTAADNSAANAIKQAEADLALSTASKAFDAKQYDEAVKAIMGASKSFNDPDRQVKALYLLAECKAATASTPDTLADAGLAYMRVVANFKALSGAPVAESLYKTAAIEEKLRKPDEALLIYRQIVAEFPKDSKTAQDAQAAITRILNTGR